MSDNGHYIFCLDDKYYLYDFLGGAIMELHKELYDTILSMIIMKGAMTVNMSL